MKLWTEDETKERLEDMEQTIVPPEARQVIPTICAILEGDYPDALSQILVWQRVARVLALEMYNCPSDVICVQPKVDIIDASVCADCRIKWALALAKAEPK